MPFENLMFFEFCMGPKTTKQGNTDTIGKKAHQIKHYPLQKGHHKHSRFKVARFNFVNWDVFSNAVWCLFQAAGT